MTAVLATTLVGFGGLAAETAFWYAQKRALQTQADAAALSGAYELLQGNAANAARWATNDAVLNGFNNTAPNAISSTCNGTSCQVTLTLQHSTALASAFLPTVTIKEEDPPHPRQALAEDADTGAPKRPYSGPNIILPVRFPPGRERLCAKPEAMGSATLAMTIGIEPASCLATAIAGVATATRMSALSCTNLRTASRVRSRSPSVKWASTVKSRPSI